MRHPEEAAAARYVRGFALEVGCGSNPTSGVAVTLDHTPGGEAGAAGGQEGEISRAGVCGEMDALPFPDGTFDTLVARHVLEHHPDTLGVLREWRRVADRLVVICPDQETYPGNTLALDPTHRACFTRAQLLKLVEQIYDRAWAARCVPNWSFVLVTE